MHAIAPAGGLRRQLGSSCSSGRGSSSSSTALPAGSAALTTPTQQPRAVAGGGSSAGGSRASPPGVSGDRASPHLQQQPQQTPSRCAGRAAEAKEAAEAALVVAQRAGLLRLSPPEEVWRSIADEDVPARSTLKTLTGGSESCRSFRVTSSTLMPIYMAVRASMDQPEERLLWHGTSWRCLPNILRSGFNRAYAGRHGTKLGVGSYFSPDPAYALRFSDRGPGPRVLLLASVLVGRFAEGSPGLLEPPLLPDGGRRDAEGEGEAPLALAGAPATKGGGLRYDSTVDRRDRPRIFCVFRDFQAVPVALFVLGG